jgi:phthiodiolone/phenolphthiodiolone dimycocerosates ketoreductase
MKVGLALGSFPPLSGVQKSAVRAASLGFDSLWWQDHLVQFQSDELWRTSPISQFLPDPHAMLDPFIAMAACAPDSGHTLLGTCVTDSVRRMPATIVQTAMTLDQLAPGRIVIGMGSGEAMNYRPYGWDVASPTARFAEAAASMRYLLDHAGPDENGAVMGLRPVGAQAPQLWLAAHGPKTFEITGRYADGWLPAFLNAKEWLAGKHAVQAAAVQAGRGPGDIRLAASVLVAVGPDPARLREVVGHPVVKAIALALPPERFTALGATHPLAGSGVHRLIPTQMGRSALLAAERVPYEVSASHVIHGSTRQVAETLAGYEGLEHVVLWDVTPIVDPPGGRAALQACVELAEQLR